VNAERGGGPSFSFYRERVADRDMDLDRQIAAAPADVTGFHTGAFALVPIDDGQTLAAIRGFRARDTLCTVDVNMRPQFARNAGIEIGKYRDAALAAVSSAHVAKVSNDDLHHLGFAGEPRVAARALLHHGCRLVVLTLGADGAWVITPEAETFQEAEPVGAVDSVGADDCFFAGFIASLHRQGILNSLRESSVPPEALRSALQHASVCAALNVIRKGCAPPTWQEANAWRSPRS
jgi:fructokinase